MTMSIVPIRLPDGLVKDIDSLVQKGDYSSRSDVVRAALRKLLWDGKLRNLVGIMPNTGDSVKEVQELRKRLSKQKIDLKKINRS